MEERFFHTILQELCKEMDIKMEKLSYGWILQLTKDGKVRHITRNHMDHNPEASSDIANDKYATYEVLQSQQVPVIKHTMIFNPAERENLIPEEGIWQGIEEQFANCNALVVKPNDGAEGEGVTLCYTKKELEIAIQKLFKTHPSVSVCPYYEIQTEYRVFYLNGEILLIYGKNKPFVIGDGNKTLEQLVLDLKLPDKKVVQDNLENLELNSIPKLGEKVFISWKHNLSGGAKPVILSKGKQYDKIEFLAKQVGKAMNINFATIDIIHTKQDDYYVLEVNSGVCATIFAQEIEDGYEIVKGIYRKALEALFQ